MLNNTFPARPLRAVLDTNIVMDMLHFSDSRTVPLRTALDSGRMRCFSNTDCLAELERVTGYPAFRLDEAGRCALMREYFKFAAPCEAEGEESHPLPRCRDADDQKFLILAARCQADLLVTRDKLLLRLARHRRCPPPFAIVTAEEAGKLFLFPPEQPAQAV